MQTNSNVLIMQLCSSNEAVSDYTDFNIYFIFSPNVIDGIFGDKD